MQTLLVTKDDFASYADLPSSLELARLTPHILAVQRTRLPNLLTDALLAELLRQVSVATQAAPLGSNWATLLEQVVPVVCCAALARYTPFAQSTFTAGSLVRKTSTHSEPVESQELARMAKVYDGDALTFEVQCSKWLVANASQFVGFYPQGNCCGAGQPARTPSVVVQAIRRPGQGPPTRQWPDGGHVVVPSIPVPTPVPTPPAPTGATTDPNTSALQFVLPSGYSLDTLEVANG